MSITLNLTNPINWLIAVALLVLLLLQGWLIWRNKSLHQIRKGIRLVINGLLWALLVGYFLQPRWSADRPATHALLIGSDVSAAFARHVRDSLHIRDVFTARMGKVDYDSVTLVGQRFPPETLPRLSNTVLHWIRYDAPDQLFAINWKGIIQEGEMQRVSGRIRSAAKQFLWLRYGSQTIDSLALEVGKQSFSLQFPAFSRGRTQTELVLGKSKNTATVLDTIRFFTRPVAPLCVQFILNNPDFESKMLADWLGKNGHSVQLSTTLSRNISSNTRINTPAKSVGTPDVLITEPANAASVTVRKALGEGRAVVFIGLTDAEADCRAINQALGTRFMVKKVSNEPAIPISTGLTGLPYRFSDAAAQLIVPGYPIAIQRTVSRTATGHVGISLLNETFPLSLSGDNTTYNRIWTAVLARVHPSQNTVLVNAPVVSGALSDIRINNQRTILPVSMRVGPDTVRLIRSPLNAHTATGHLLMGEAGWQSVNDSLAIFVQATHPANTLTNSKIVSRFMLAHEQYQSVADLKNHQTEWQLPGWSWLLLFLVGLSMLWVEPKL